MTRHEPFDLEVGEGVVRGTLRAPGAGGASPCVLICCDLPGSVDVRTDLVDELTDTLLAEGLACAQFGPRDGDAEAASRASTVIDDAAAVFRWLLLRDDIDDGRIGAFGHGLGAIVAASLAGRTDQIARLCLLAPATNDEAIARIRRPSAEKPGPERPAGEKPAGEKPAREKPAREKPNGLPPLLDPGAVPEAFVTSLANLAPTTAIAVHDRATLIVHGAADRVIPPSSAQPYLRAIEKADHRVEHELIALADHALSEGDLRALCLARIRRFFAGLKNSDAA